MKEAKDIFVMPVEVIPDLIQEIRYYSAFNFVGARVDGYLAPVAWLTKEAAAALREAADEFRSLGYVIKVYDAYRPQRAVDHFVRWAADIPDTRMEPYFYPGVDKTKLFDMGFIAKKSGHSRGSTVDLTLVNMVSGKELDTGGGFDFFGGVSYHEAPGLTDRQREDRRLLRSVMDRHGFRTIEEEWWHYTLRNEPYPDTYFDYPVELMQ